MKGGVAKGVGVVKGVYRTPKIQRQTPPAHRQTPPAETSTEVDEWAVCILLECILVKFKFNANLDNGPAETVVVLALVCRFVIENSSIPSPEQYHWNPKLIFTLGFTIFYWFAIIFQCCC